MLVASGRSYWMRVKPYLRRYKLPLLGAAGILLVLILAVQFLYPSDKALPRARLVGQPAGGKTREELAQRINESFESAELELKAGDKSKKIALREIGATVEAEVTADKMLSYPWWQRLIPLSFIIKSPEAKTFYVSLSSEQLSVVGEALAKELSYPAEDAKLTIADGALATTAAKPGHEVRAESVTKTLNDADFHFGTTVIALETEEHAPAITDDDIAGIRGQAEKILQREIVVVAEDGKEFKPEPSDITSWLAVALTNQNKPELVTNPEQITAYINGLNDEVGVRPGTAKATMIDGQEVSRTNAPSGLAIASDELQEGIKNALLEESAPRRLNARMVTVAPNVEYVRNYTSTEKGLRAYIEYLTTSENVRIAVSEIGGKNWSAYGRGDEQTVSASTYKLYVALMLFKQISEGKLQWGSKVLDSDTNTCLERMIVQSDNPCAEEFIRMFDGRQINAYLYSKGISRGTTVITEDGLARTTASDLQKALRGIEDGNWLSSSDRTKLLELMGRQRYRSGIPAGSSGTVYDKVGFLLDYIHDAAIVKHPKGTYTIAVLTKGYSWSKVAEITNKIEQILYP